MFIYKSITLFQFFITKNINKKENWIKRIFGKSKKNNNMKCDILQDDIIIDIKLSDIKSSYDYISFDDITIPTSFYKISFTTVA